MKKIFPIVFLVILLLGLGTMLLPKPDLSQKFADVALPWQVEVRDDGSSRVLGLHLGKDDLRAAVNRYGDPDGIALFITDEGKRSLEAYFDKIFLGPLEAKLVVSLQASEEEIDDMLSRANKRAGSKSGDAKILITERDQLSAMDHRIESIVFIPKVRNLEADYYRARFGEPAAWKKVDEESVRWFYPERGFSLLLDSAGGEMIEYMPPRNFRLPDKVTPNEAAN